VLGFLLFLAIMLGSASIGIGMLVNTVPTPFAPEVFTTPAQNAVTPPDARVLTTAPPPIRRSRKWG
jgi:hypothetical protein